MRIGFLDRIPRVGQTWVEGSKKEYMRSVDFVKGLKYVTAVRSKCFR